MKKALLTVLLFATGCDRSGGDAPMQADVIGSRLRFVDPNRRQLEAAEAILLAATTQGLVRYDGAGQIEPGIAIRWAISDDGLYYTFRLDRDLGLDADLVARRLRAKIARSSDNAIKPVLGAIDEIVAVTPEVIEIRLRAARPNLLDLLAQPELGILGSNGGTGPLKIEEKGEVLRLAPAAPDNPDRAPDAAERSRRQVLLRSETAATAIARFDAGRTDIVLNGRFSDLPLAHAASIRTRELRFDPAEGLFGLAVARRNGLAGTSENRMALAMALDRARMLAAFGAPDWRESVRLVPEDTIERPKIESPPWAANSLDERRSAARNVIAGWRQRHSADSTRLRVSLPPGLGSRLLFAYLRADWAAIGVDAIRVDEGEPTDLRLIDEVAPSQSASWYLRRFACARSPVCSEVADRALDAARESTDRARRAELIFEADRSLGEAFPFIPIARPLRWSLVSARATAFRTNNRGVHPLNHLREDTR